MPIQVMLFPYFSRSPEDVVVKNGRLHGLRIGLVIAVLGALAPVPLDAERALFRSPSHTVSLFVLPGETVPFDLAGYSGIPARAIPGLEVEVEVGLVVARKEGRFQVTAPPTPGIYGVRFQEPASPGLARPLPYHLQLVVMRPASEAVNGLLNGYPVGIFPEPELGARWRFEAPRGFVEINESNRTVLLSDHIELGELDCKLLVPYPHYAVIQTSLLVKLEGLIDLLKQRGLPGESLRIMSGFRTPDYNRTVGNETTWSRHLAGDAADVFVDRNGDDRMDDLNGDGRVNRRDARFLLGMVESMDESPEYGALVGGASAYRANTSHGPFLHVDARGYPARW